MIAEHTLHHGETLLVIAAGNLEHVTLELLAERVGGNLSGDALVEEGQELLVVVNLDALLLTRQGVRDVQLHFSLRSIYCTSAYNVFCRSFNRFCFVDQSLFSI